MTSEESEELEIVWKLRDPAHLDDELVLEFYVLCANKREGLGPAVIVQEILAPAGGLSESEGAWADELYAEFSLAVEAWCETHGVVLLEEPASVGQQVMALAGATETQRANYEVFLADDLAEDAIDACLSVVALADLPGDELGDTWGVTVVPAKDVLLRINAGNRVLLDIRRSGRVALYVVATDAELSRLPPVYEVDDGFAAVENSKAINAQLGELFEELLDTPGVASWMAAHAKASWRRLPNENWHNPLTEQFLFRSDDEDTMNADPVPQDSSSGVVAHSGRYQPLWEWLRTHPKQEFRTSFSELEREAGISLPNSSRAHVAHWHSYQGSAVARAIHDAGWHAHHVDVNAQLVTLTPGPSPRTRS